MGAFRELTTALVAIASLFYLASPSFAQSPEPGPGLVRRPARSESSTLRLRAAHVDLSTQPTLLANPANIDRNRPHVIHLNAPINAVRRAALLQTGLILHDYLPINAFLVDLSQANPAQLAALDFIDWIGPYENNWKLCPEIGALQPNTPQRQAIDQRDHKLLTLILFRGKSPDASIAAINALNGIVHAVDTSTGRVRLGVEIPAEKIADLADLPDLMFAEESPEGEPRNATTTWICQSNVLNSKPLWDRGLHGEGQIVGLIDYKMMETHCAFSDPVNPIGPTHRKIQAYYGLAGPNVSPSHGTHVAGVFCGDEQADTLADLKGMAYEARLVFQNFPTYLSTPAAAGLYARLVVAHGDGARIHSNSWGSDSSTAYSSWSHDFDQFTWDYEDDLTTVATTNQNALVKIPENAKNIIAIAATNDDPNQGSRCWGGFGPTTDGRQKPEVWAPGCGSVSARYSTTSTCGVTVASGGTSYAAPAVSGMATLARQYYMSGFYPGGAANAPDAFTPSGALLKATIINSCVDMSGWAGYFTSPEGWGRLLMDDSLYFSGDARKLLLADTRNADGLDTGQSHPFEFDVIGAAIPLKITLVWTDYPAVDGATFTPVNNLDLLVTDPNGITYKGNNFGGTLETATGGSHDALNNTEQVHRLTPVTGTWSLQVLAPAVNHPTQGYALLITGNVANLVGCTKADVNADGSIDGRDADAFVRVVIDGGSPVEDCAADMNDTSGPGPDDVADFVAELLN